MNSIKFALRAFAKTPGFTATALVTLALGIGLNTAMFSIINTLLLQPLEYPEPHRLFWLQRTTAQQERRQHAVPNVLEILRDGSDAAEMAAARSWGFTLAEPNRPAEVLNSLRVSANFFNILGVQPELGRAFRAEEDQPGGNRVLVLSHAFWVNHYAADPAVIGRVVRLDGEPNEIIGVLPLAADSLWPLGGPAVYRPVGFNPDERINYSDLACEVIGRLRPGITPAQANARFTAIAAKLAKEHPKENGDSGLVTKPMSSARLDRTGRQITYLLLGLSGFVLLIACANLANLLLARALTRAREFAIRSALGASRAQLIRPLMVETVLLALAGGALGVLVSVWTNRWFAHQLRGDGPKFDFVFDWRVVGFAGLASVITAVCFGVAPALLVSRVQVNDALKSGARGATGSGSQQRFRQLLIASQFALALVLLAGAGFFVRGLDRLVHTEAGWAPAPLVRGVVSLPTGTYTTPDRLQRFYDEALRRLSALPGVERTAVSYELPTFPFTGPRTYLVEHRPAPLPGQEPTAFVNGVSPDYFATVGTRIVSGRAFSLADRIDAPRVVIINRAMARALFPGEDAVGRRLGSPNGKTTTWAEIVGVAEDVRFLNIGPSPVRFQLYQPIAQEPWGYVTFTVRAGGGAASLVEPFRRTIAEIDADLPVMGLMPVPAFINRVMSDIAAINQLLVVFAVLGLFLATLGIYGTIARLVTQRTPEIGMRIALGAQLRDVVRLILGTGLRMAAAGAVAGLIGAIALARFLSAAMPGLATGNVTAVVGASGVLVLVALVACWLPARRAAKVDPVIALRAE